MRKIGILDGLFYNLFTVIRGVTTHEDVINHLNGLIDNLNVLYEDIEELNDTVNDIPDLIDEKIEEAKPIIRIGTITTSTDASQVGGTVIVIGNTYTINLVIPASEGGGSGESTPSDFYVASDLLRENRFHSLNNLSGVSDYIREIYRIRTADGLPIQRGVTLLFNPSGLNKSVKIYYYIGANDSTEFQNIDNWESVFVGNTVFYKSQYTNLSSLTLSSVLGIIYTQEHLDDFAIFTAKKPKILVVDSLTGDESDMRGIYVYVGNNSATSMEVFTNLDNWYCLSSGGSSVVVENNLTSTSTSSALSANMGRELKEMIDNIGGGGSAVIVVDNLNSTSTTSALSANQGRILNNKIPTVNNTLTSTSTSEALSANQGRELKALIDAIPAPVSVVNNLTSDSTTSALSAAQGKALKEMIESGSNMNYQRVTTAQYNSMYSAGTLSPDILYIIVD